ncbi:MAG TPA: hypothetical protein VHU43_02250 [Steroidobacteraceae bacterium]|jgi:hypothetical protein|nr:hypothetical protein [Steroidobacteraceae bacterium]
MDNTMRGAAEAALTPGNQSAVQNHAQATSKLKLLLVWLAVALPLIWGVIKTLEDGSDLVVP